MTFTVFRSSKYVTVTFDSKVLQSTSMKTSAPQNTLHGKRHDTENFSYSYSHINILVAQGLSGLFSRKRVFWGFSSKKTKTSLFPKESSSKKESFSKMESFLKKNLLLCTKIGQSLCGQNAM